MDAPRSATRHLEVAAVAPTAAPTVAPTVAPPSGSLVRVRVLSRSSIVRHGLRTVLQGHRDVLLTPHEHHHDADVVLFVLGSTDAQDCCTLEHLTRRGPCVVVTAADRPDLVARAVDLGAHACVTSDTTTADLVSALLDAAQVAPHPRPPSPAVVGRSWRHDGTSVGLTPRELQVVDLVAAGMQDREIAELLSCHPSCVDVLVRACHRKIGARSRAHLVLWGRTRSLDEPA